ncbi:hypothetical protein Tco_1120554 [Tanacetum coccineum]
MVIKRSKTQTHSSHASGSGVDEGTGDIPGVPDVPIYGSDDEQISWKSSKEDDEDEVNVSEKDDDNDNNDDDNDADNQDDENQDEENQDNDDDKQTNFDNDGDDFVYPKFSTHDDEARQNEEDSFDPRVQTPSHVESTDDVDDDEEVQGVNIEDEKTNKAVNNEEDGGNELYRDLNVNLEGSKTMMTDASLLHVQATQEIEDTHVILTASINPEGQHQSSSVSSGFVSNMLNPRPDTGIDSIFNTKATSLVDVPVTNISEPPLVFAITLPPPPTPLITHMQQTSFPIPTTALTVSSIPGIVDAYLVNKMNDAVKTVVQLQSDRLRDEVQAKNEDFLNKLNDNIKKIIKEQVKEQVKAQVSKILPKYKKTVNEQLEEQKKILIEKMESNKSINRSNEQNNIYKALVEAYKSDKLILDTYGDTVSFKRRRDDKDKDEEPSAGSNRGSKIRRAGKEPESTKTTQHPDLFQKPAKPPTPDRDWNKTLPAVHGQVQPWLSNLAWEKGTRESFDELMDTLLDFSTFMMNQLKIDTLTPELLAGITFEMMKGTCKSLVELEYFFEEVYKATTDRLDWHNPKAYLSGGVSSRTYATSVTKTQAADYGNIKWIEDLVPNTMWSEVPVNYDKHALWGISHWGRKRQKFYGFTANKESAHDEGDFKRLHLQDIEDMLIFLVQGKLTNLNVKDRLVFCVSLRMFTRSIIIQRRVKDLQLGVKSYQKKLNITKPDTYRSDLKRKDAYIAYSIPRGFIYLNKDKKNKLMRIDELHKFSDGTLDDV